MPHFPRYDEFAELAKTHTVVPVYRRLVADALTPVMALRRMAGGDWRFLFESVVGGERIGRYSFLGERPFRRFEAFGNTVREKIGDGNWTESTHADPLKLLEERVAEYRAPKIPGVPAFCGAAVGFVGYDAVRYVEKLPNAPLDDRHLPDLCFGFFGGMVVFDHINKTLLVVAHVRVPELAARTTHKTLKDAYQDACDWVDDTVARLEPAPDDRVALRLQDIHVPTSYSVPERYTSNFTRESWQAMMAKGIDYIRAGDVFQYVPSQRFQTTTNADSFDIYRALRVINPSPFMFYLDTGSVILVGASPEILCRVENREMTVRPLAGTRKRGATAAEDQALATELLADPKERAEHIMLVDLGRNDVGKVSEIGSVRLNDLMAVERYSHVMHISSTVTGTLKPELTAFDALRSALPAGTLSGAPKVRAMEVIDELEPHRRGPYGGAVGYIDFTGNMDTCIALRTMVMQGKTISIQAGCGVVADSDPETEYQETVNKAMGLMRAVEVAESQLTPPAP